MPARREEPGIAGEDGEEQEDQDGAGDRAQLGPPQELGEASKRRPARLSQALEPLGPKSVAASGSSAPVALAHSPACV